MKILELRLQAFGPFTDVVLDLSGGSEGLHLVFGPNEAGKSSAMRALRQALFEIPGQSPDDFIHSYQKMRIGLKLRGGDGRELEFVRRKGKQNTLLAADGATPLPDDALRRVLNGLTKAELEKRFTLDHDELIQGGRSILEGGELGGLLFQAGGGLKNLLEVQRELTREIEDLFKPGGSKPRINAGLAELKQANEATRTASLKSSEWREHDAACRQAEARLGEIEGRLASAQAEKRRLERLQKAIPLVARRRQCLEELAALGEVVLLPPSFPETRREVQSRIAEKKSLLDRAVETIAALDRQLGELSVPADLLAEADAIERLREALPLVQKARKNLPAEEGKLQQILSDAHDLLAELRPDLAAGIRGGPASEGGFPALIAAGEGLRLSRAQKGAIQRLASEWSKLAAEHEQALKQIESLDRQIEDEQNQLDRIEPPRDAAPLALALRQARDQGDLDAVIETARGRLNQAAHQAERALARLPLWSGTLEALEAVGVPAAETIDRFEAEFSQLDAEQNQLRTDRRNAAVERAEAEAELERLRQVAGTVPTEDDLAQARTARDRIWHLIRRAWEGADPPEPEEIREALAPGEGTTFAAADLPDAYERAVAQADSHSDRLRREVKRVAEQAAAQANLYKARQRLELLEVQEAQAIERTEALRARWLLVWETLKFEPLTPREMRGWLQARQDLLKQAGEIQAQRAEVEGFERKADQHRRLLGQALLALGEAEETSGESFAMLRDRASEVVDRIEAVETGRGRRTESVGKLQREREAARSRAGSAAKQLEHWRARWAEAVAPLGLPPEAAPDQANETLEQAANLLARLKEARETRTRIEGLEREAIQFSREISDLCRRAAPDLTPDVNAIAGPGSTENAARELIRRYHDAVQARTQREGLLEQHRREEAVVEEARQAIEEAAARLDALCLEARCAEAAELPEAEQRSRQAEALRNRLQELDERLGELCANESPEAFREAAEALDVDRLPERLRTLGEEIDGLDASRSTLNQELGRERQILAQMDGGAGGAGAAENVEELKAHLAVEIEEYARLRLAAEVLHQAIERFRQKNQGPVLNRAGALFSSLTLGSFEGLKVDYDDRDQPVLRALRPGGTETVGVEGLSLGTADQLYLALRLASLETYLDSHEPVPLVVDDVLIQFDDGRAAAALRALAEISRRTQVVLFTHHDHVCQLAQSCVDPAQLIISRLPGRTGRERAATSR